MQGLAIFKPRGDGLVHYREEGLATLNGSARTFSFSNSYLYRLDAPALCIFFDEPTPRIFQEIVLAENTIGWRGVGLHLCAPDTYRSQYAFQRDGRFRMRHAVSGPRKSHVIETQFIRSAIASANAEPCDMADA